MKKESSQQEKERRSRVSQSDVPAYSLNDALRVPTAIADNYALAATKPLDLAAALSMSPTSSYFRMLCGTSIAYGLTEGGYNAVEITVTPLARRILRPTIEGDEFLAKREAFLKPRILRDFLTKYNSNKLPKDEIALNVLEQMGVPRDSVKRTLDLIIEGSKTVGFFTEIKGQSYVNLQGISPVEKEKDDSKQTEVLDEEQLITHKTEPKTTATDSKTENRRVFISHGKNKAFLETLKELLSFGELQPVISVETETVSQPVPDKVMSEMRKCSAAIIHVDTEQKVLTQDAEQKVILNPNVLIEIGAAMALYGRRFILLVRDGTNLPSNLQGLYEVRYQGDKLDGEVTIRLLKAIRDIKNHPLPQMGTS
jgi:predicted nucleotide-binding protein